MSIYVRAWSFENDLYLKPSYIGTRTHCSRKNHLLCRKPKYISNGTLLRITIFRVTKPAHWYSIYRSFTCGTWYCSSGSVVGFLNRVNNRLFSRADYRTFVKIDHVQFMVGKTRSIMPDMAWYTTTNLYDMRSIIGHISAIIKSLWRVWPLFVWPQCVRSIFTHFNYQKPN